MILGAVTCLAIVLISAFIVALIGTAVTAGILPTLGVLAFLAFFAWLIYLDVRKHGGDS